MMLQQNLTCTALGRHTPRDDSDATIEDSCTSHAGHGAADDEVV